VKKYLSPVIRILEEGGLVVEACTTRGAGDPARLAREVDGQVDAVLVAGGDGSINEAIHALAGKSTPIGILPFGTVNVFAREMGVPLHPLKAARAFLESRVQSFDVGRIGERRFLLMASYGFDARILRSTPSRLKRIFGRYAYAITAFLLIPTYKNAPLQVFTGQEASPIKAHFALFSNARCYAGNYVVAPDADMQDGFLDLLLFNSPGRLGLFRIALAITSSRLQAKSWITRIRANQIRLESHEPDLFQIDGDPIRIIGDTITVEPSGIQMVIL